MLALDEVHAEPPRAEPDIVVRRTIAPRGAPTTVRMQHFLFSLLATQSPSTVLVAGDISSSTMVMV